MTGADMKRVAIIVYGAENWAGALSVRLGVNRRTIERAGQGQREIPPGWQGELKAIYTARINEILRAIESL